MKRCEFCGKETCLSVGTSYGSVSCCQEPECMHQASLASDAYIDRFESKRSFELLKQAGRGFEAMFKQLMYHSDNVMVSDKMHELESLLSEFTSECEYAEKHVMGWYRD